MMPPPRSASTIPRTARPIAFLKRSSAIRSHRAKRTSHLVLKMRTPYPIGANGSTGSDDCPAVGLAVSLAPLPIGSQTWKLMARHSVPSNGVWGRRPPRDAGARAGRETSLEEAEIQRQGYLCVGLSKSGGTDVR